MKRNTIRILLTLCVFTILACVNSAVNVEKMDTNTASLWKNENVVKILDSTYLELSIDEERNTLMENTKEIYYVQNSTSLEMSDIVFYYNTVVEKKPSVSLTVVYSDGKVWKLSPHKIKYIEASNGVEYRTNLHGYVAEIPKYQKGMYIIKEEKRVYLKPEHLHNIKIRSGYNIYKKYVTLSVPKNSAIKYQFINPEQLKVDTVRSVGNENISYTIKADKVPKVSKYSTFKYPEEWLAGFYMSIPPRGNRSFTWSELGDYYLNGLNESLNFNNQELIAQSKKIKGTSNKEIIKNAFSFVTENIRYHADERGIHSWIARPPATILSQGYGDCKEMTTLLKALLYHRGIESNLTITSTKGYSQIIEEIPTLGGFNHMILSIKNSDNSISYYDPTINYANSNNSYYPVLNRKVFILGDKKSKVEKVNKNKDYKNSILTKNKIEKIKSRWQISGTIELYGKSAFTFYPLFISVNDNEKEEITINVLNMLFEMDVENATIITLKSDYTKIEYKADFTSKYLNLDDGGFKLDIPYFYGGKSGYTTVKREGNLYFEDKTQTDYWEIPKGFSIEKSIKDKGIVSGSWEMKGNKVIRKTSNIYKVLNRNNQKELKEYRKTIKKLSSINIWKE